MVHEQHKRLDRNTEGRGNFRAIRVNGALRPIRCRIYRLAHFIAGARQRPHAPTDGRPRRFYIQKAGVYAGAALLDPASVDQQHGLIFLADKGRQHVIAMAAVDDDVFQQELVVVVITTGGLDSLKWPYFHPVLPRSEAGLGAERGALRALLQTAADLPHAESRELDYQQQQRSDYKRQPGWQRLFRPGVHGIMKPREGAVMKVVVIILLAAIVVSLGTGLFYLRREDADSPKMLRALEIRVGLSLVLILFLIASYFMGWILPPTQ